MVSTLRNSMPLKPIGQVMPVDQRMQNPLDYNAIWQQSPSYRQFFGSPDPRADMTLPGVAQGTIPHPFLGPPISNGPPVPGVAPGTIPPPVFGSPSSGVFGEHGGNWLGDLFNRLKERRRGRNFGTNDRMF